MSTKSKLFTGDYLFHLHTCLTDGTQDIRDYFAFAQHNVISRLIFLEHIHRTPSYDVDKFCHDVARASYEYGIEAHVGFEARLLPEGVLDISRSAVEAAEVIGLAEHKFPNDVDLLERTFVKAIDTFREEHEAKVLIWVHPGLWFKKRGLETNAYPEFGRMVAYALSAEVKIERNLRYNVPAQEVLKTLDNGLVTGADAHSVADLERWLEFRRQ